MERAIRLSARKYCLASIMLGATAEISHDFEFREASVTEAENPVSARYDNLINPDSKEHFGGPADGWWTPDLLRYRLAGAPGDGAEVRLGIAAKTKLTEPVSRVARSP